MSSRSTSSARPGSTSPRVWTRLKPGAGRWRGSALFRRLRPVPRRTRDLFFETLGRDLKLRAAHASPGSARGADGRLDDRARPWRRRRRLYVLQRVFLPGRRGAKSGRALRRGKAGASRLPQRIPFSRLEYEELRRETDVFTDVAAFRPSFPTRIDGRGGRRHVRLRQLLRHARCCRGARTDADAG